jgi:hypothetical protein
MPELPAGGVNAVGGADLAAEFLAQGVQWFVGFDAILAEPGDPLNSSSNSPVLQDCLRVFASKTCAANR